MIKKTNNAFTLDNFYSFILIGNIKPSFFNFMSCLVFYMKLPEKGLMI